jgi:geranylgeranyl pyrophosphate synthase
MVHYGGIEHSLEKAKEYSRVCKESLRLLEKSEHQNTLALLVDYVVGRVC